MNIIQQPSPNFDERNAEISMLILHYTGMQSGLEAIERLCDPVSRVSSHYVLEENGDVYQLVDESKRAWHAGVSFWRGLKNVNANSIGIEIVNPGHEFGYRRFTEAQYVALVELCSGIIKRHNIKPENVVGHSDIAPDRKEDPGELFDWKRLAKHGIGLWPDFKPCEIKGELTDLGYEAKNMHSMIAFQRHWRPQIIDGRWDDECQDILNSLLSQIG